MCYFDPLPFLSATVQVKTDAHPAECSTQPTTVWTDPRDALCQLRSHINCFITVLRIHS